MATPNQEIDAKLQQEVDAKLQQEIDAKLRQEIDAKLQQEVDATLQQEMEGNLQKEKKTLGETLWQCASVNAEYLVQLPAQANDEHRKAIYQILMTFSFPMNTNPINRAYIEKTLTSAEIDALNNSEMQFLQEKINKEVLQGVILIPIPKTIYQLYFVVQAFSEQQALPEFVCPDNNTEELVKKMNRKLDYAGLIQTIQHPQYLNAWWKVNNNFLRDWEKVSSLEGFDPFIDTQIDRLVSLVSAEPCRIPRAYIAAASNGCTLSVFIKDHFKKDKGFILDHDVQMQTAKALFKRVALEEALEPRFYILYSHTGVQFDGSSSFSKESSEAPTYFFDGLLTSFLYEPRYAPFLKLIGIQGGTCSKDEQLYVHSLDKHKYLNKDNVTQKSLFFIPPFPRMLNLVLYNYYNNINLPQNYGDLKSLRETSFQEKEGISSISAELQKVQNFYETFQEANSSLRLPSGVATIIFRYTVDQKLGDVVVRRAGDIVARKDASKNAGLKL